ncbi:MAG TPA: hypothetical protein VNE39_26080 [Planctomycetota bacterium]|nr:hypothetical protein [Planctomycetota bacterium]
MASRKVKCPECGHEFEDKSKWGGKDWALYLVAVVPIGLMALVIVGMGVVAMLRFLGITSR